MKKSRYSKKMAEMKLPFTKLSQDNYFSWKYKMQMYLIREDLWDVIEDTPPNQPGADAEAQVLTSFNNWKKRDNKTRATISLFVEDSQLCYIRNEKTAKATWDALKNHHEKNTLTNKVSIMRRICSAKLKESGDIESHLAELTNWFQKLTDLGDQLVDSWKIAMILSSLPESYDGLVTALEARSEEDLTLSLVLSKLTAEYQRRSEKNGDTVTVLKTAEKKELFCHFCKKKNHLKKDCRKLKQQKNKQQSKQPNDKKEASNSIQESNEQLFSLSASNNNNDWLLDSGATSHVVNNANLLSNINTQQSSKIDVANGDKETVHGKGTCFIPFVNNKGDVTKTTLTDVLYAPQITGNMLSVSKLCAADYKVCFTKSACEIYDNNNKQVATADEINGLYKLRKPNKVCTLKNESNCIHYWHRVLGHRDPAAIKQMISTGMINGIKIADCGVKLQCEVCLKAKLTRLPFPKQSESKTAHVLDLVHSDVCGPMQTQTPSGKRYVLTFIDDYSKYTHIFLLREKSEVEEKIKEYVNLVENQLERKVKLLRSDRGGEYMSASIEKYLKEKGIRTQLTAPYSPQQNGTAERKNRTLIEMARCLLLDAKLPKTFWGEAVNTANYIQNRVLTRSTNATPFELWYKKKPSVSHFEMFGSKCYVHIPKEKRRKLDDTSREMIFIGYDEQSKAYRCYDSNTKKVIVSRDIRFVKNTVHGSEIEIDLTSSKSAEETSNNPDLVELPNDGDDWIPSDSSDSTHNYSGDVESNNDTQDSGEDRVERRSKRGNLGVPPNRLGINYSLSIVEPKTFTQALQSEHKSDWIDAMQSEIDSLKKNDTWELSELPNGREAIDCKWIYKQKMDAKGNLIRYKARLVARGFTQKYGTDYDEVFAPVARQATFRTLLAIASKEKMHVRHLDVKTAFLNGKLKEQIFMKQPPGFIIEGKERLVCRLKKAIYGLKQSAKVWNSEIHRVLIEMGFQQSKADNCLYTSDWCFVLIFVDDIVVAAKSPDAIEKVIKTLTSKFEIEDLGEIKHYLGVEVTKDTDGIYHLCQSAYINKVVNEFGLSEAKTSSVPIQMNYGKSKDSGSSDLLLRNNEYQSLVGSLLFLAINTRPDIAASISILAQKVSNPNQEDWNELKRVVRYLKGTSQLKLALGAQTDKLFYGYADANWAESKSDRKSNSGYVFLVNGGVVSWASRKQTCVALSSTEAEFIALSEACKEAIWLRQILADLRQPINSATTIYEDNQSCLNLIQEEKLSNRTKHIDVRAHFVKDHIDKGDVICEYCPTEEMLADMLTKPIPTAKFKKLRDLCNLFD